MRFVVALFRSFVDSLKSSRVRAPKQLLSVTHDCLPEALPILAEQLRAFGARVSFSNGWSGVVASEAGELFFKYRGGSLTVTVTKDLWHFPRLMLIGGMRQTIEEANEIVLRAHAESRSFEIAQESAEA